MKEFFLIAENLIGVETRGECGAWEELRSRFSPFLVRKGAELSDRPDLSDRSDLGESLERGAVLEIEIREGELPAEEGEPVYEPEHSGAGEIASRAWRREDGSLVMEFRHVGEERGRLWMRIDKALDRAEIVMAVGGRDASAPNFEDKYFLAHGMMIAFMLGTLARGSLLIHASAVLYDGKAFLFQGKSGTGKSTHARLWVENIEGAELLNDDNPIIRFGDDGRVMAYGSPWSGKTPCYRNVSAPVGGFVRIVRAPFNELRRLSPLKGYASLTTSVFYLPFMGEALRDARHADIEQLAMHEACYEMYCRPDEAAARVCLGGLG